MNETIQVLKTRRACRKYREEQVREEDLQQILEAGTYAPTGMGRQSPVIVVLQKPEDIAEVERLNARAIGNADAHTFYGAPTVIMVLADSNVPTYMADGNLVCGNLLNAAHAVGVDSCYIHRAQQVIDSPEGQALLKKWGLPDSLKGVGNVILGYGLPEGKKAAAPRKEGYVVRV